MKVLKIIGSILLVLVVIVLIAGALMKKDLHYEQTTTINAPKERVWENVVMFENHKKWSQWKEKDPNMKVNITGVDGTVGARMSWTSDHKEVGNGSQTITGVDPGNRVDTELDFDGRGKAKSYMVVTGDSTSSQVTWALDMHPPYPFNAIVPLMMGNGMNEMFDKGLAMLKSASEK
jgi:uncharacterized protein YndB with AHSA1/START domain